MSKPTRRPEAGNPVSGARQAASRRITMILGYAIVAASVSIGFAMSLWPQFFGLSGANPAVGFGLAALALFRLYALRRELRRQDAEPEGRRSS